MAAVYPNQYSSFPTHKNLVEDIDASHVNNLQDAVVAIQQTLGIAPHQDKSLKMRTNTWASVAARLDAIQRGQGIPVCYLSKSGDSFKNNNNNPGLISFPRPSTDPETIYNGHGITANRTGWYILNAGLVWTSGTQSGDRQIGITLNGNQIAINDQPTESPDGWTFQQVSWQGPVNTGTKIDLQVYHPQTGKTLSMQRLFLAASFVREL